MGWLARESGNGETDMALKVELKPHERIIIGACVITNTDQRARLLIDGDNIPILREKDILRPETADTPAKLIYLAVQLMYISPDPQVNHGTYFNLVRDIVTAAPSTWTIIEEINNHILNGELYQALKEARKLVAYEKTLLDLNRDHNAEMARQKSRRRTPLRLRSAYTASGGDGSTRGRRSSREPDRCAPNSSTAEIRASISQVPVR